MSGNLITDDELAEEVALETVFCNAPKILLLVA
jgi:hypothetical protein